MLHQSLQDVQIVADKVPTLKTSLQKSIAASHKSQQQIAQLQSNFEASVKSLEVKEKESLLLKKEVRTANHTYRNLLAFQNDKVKEAKDSALHDFTKEVEQFITTIQTGSIQLNREFKNAYQNMVEKEWSLTDLFALIQELLTFINNQHSSKVSDLEKELDEKESCYRKVSGKFKQLNDSLKRDLAAKLMEIKELKTKLLLYQNNKLDVENMQKRLIQSFSDDKLSLQHQLNTISQELTDLKLLHTSAQASIKLLENEKISLEAQVHSDAEGHHSLNEDFQDMKKQVVSMQVSKCSNKRMN
jgi:chromosome segregation ATPase